MKLTTQNALVTIALLVATQCLTRGQGTFQNLGFESASLVPIPGDLYGRVQFAAAFPGWTGAVGSVQQTAAFYNSAFLDSSGISIIDQGWPALLGNAGVISGNFTAILQAGLGLSSGIPANTAISQTALVPAAAQSLLFEACAPGYLSPLLPLLVTLNGQRLAFTPLGSGSNYTLYGADIHTLAGQSAELGFTVPAQNPHVQQNYVFLDAIQFSSQAIPEPRPLGLVTLGALLLGRRGLRWLYRGDLGPE